MVLLVPLQQPSRDELPLVMNTVGSNHGEAHSDPLADVFGSAPPSPSSMTGGDNDGAVGTDARTASAIEDPSDIPRLRSVHVTSGYRDGIAVGKERSMQAGFDEGYALGAEIGMKVGRMTGVLEGLVSALRKSGRADAAAVQPVKLRELLGRALQELDLRIVFGSRYFGPDGVWTYEVPGQDQPEQISFREVAAAHPLLKTWDQITEDAAKQYGIVL